MSYSFSVTNVDAASVGDELAKAFEQVKTNAAANDYAYDPAAIESAEFAITVAKTMAESKLLGSKCNATISGHANPGHVPTKGWANDALSVSVASADPQPTE